MEEGMDKDGDRLGAEGWLSSWEDESIREWQRNGAAMEDRLQEEDELAAQKLWLSFQNSASSITHLYKDRCQNGGTLWVPFQNCASRLTKMYKESTETVKRSADMGKQYGHHRRTKDILNWVKRKRRTIRREELIAYLCGKAPPPRPRAGSALSRSACTVKPDRSSPRLPPLESRDDAAAEPDLRPFRDALALQRLNGAMSNISMGYKSPLGTETSPESYDDDFHCFVLEEINRRCDTGLKRNSNADVRMDSPTRKRSRLF